MTGPALCLFALFIVYSATIGYRRSKRMWGNCTEVEIRSADLKYEHLQANKGSKRKMITMTGIIVFMFVSYSLPYLSASMTAICASLLCVLTGCCSSKDVVKEMQWEFVIFLACCLGIANALTSAGSIEFVGAWASDMLSFWTKPFPIFALLVFLALAVSQVVTNSISIILMLPIALTLCMERGFSVMPFCIGITLAASIACCTPLAAAQIAMTQVAGYKFKDYLYYGWPINLIGYIGILLFVPLFYPLMGN